MEKNNNETIEVVTEGGIGSNKEKKNKTIKTIKKIIAGIFILYFIFNFTFDDYFITYDEEAPQMYLYRYRYYLKRETIDHFNQYINICWNGKLIDDYVYSLSPKPKITVIMPIYNGGKYLYYSLRSIQNQKLKDLEIIFIDDYSPDNSTDIIEKYMKEDPRIRLIKNEKNRNILYSKSMAALNAKGKYILELDQDDMFISDDAFETLYNLAEKKNLDLVQFRDFLAENFFVPYTYEDLRNTRSYIKSKDSRDNLYKTQPELKFLFFDGYNFLLWGMLIKTEIYKKIVEYLWPIIINYRLALFEDFEITFFILIFAKNFQFINYFFLIHLNHPNSVTFSYLTIKEDYLSKLFFATNMMNYYLEDHPEDIHIMINLLVILRDVVDSKNTLHYEFKQFLVRKILANNHLTYKEKKNILHEYNLDAEEYKIWNTYEYFMDSSKYNMMFSYQILINQNQNKLVKNIPLNPRFSIIVYCNEYIYLKNLINSIEHQSYDNYEIILIYDNKNNITESNLIKEFTEIYNNIKLINTMEDKGRFFSYAKGVLESKGEYLLTIEPGNILATPNTFSELNNKISDEDIIEFNLLTNSEETIKNNTLDLYKCYQHFKSKINLDLIKSNKRARPIDLKKELMKNKLIKSSIYKNIIKEYKSIFEDNVLYHYYDEIIMYLINKKEIKVKHINNIGMIQYRKIVKYFDEKNKEQKTKDTIFYINFLFEYSDNTIEGKRYAISEFYDHLNIIFNRYYKVSEEAKQLVNKFLNCKYISQYKKNNLIFYYKSLTS